MLPDGCQSDTDQHTCVEPHRSDTTLRSQDVDNSECWKPSKCSADRRRFALLEAWPPFMPKRVWRGLWAWEGGRYIKVRIPHLRLGHKGDIRRTSGASQSSTVNCHLTQAHLTSHGTPPRHASRCSRPPHATFTIRSSCRSTSAKHRTAVCCHWSCDRTAQRVKSKGQSLCPP